MNEAIAFSGEAPSSAGVAVRSLSRTPAPRPWSLPAPPAQCPDTLHLDGGAESRLRWKEVRAA